MPSSKLLAGLAPPGEEQATEQLTSHPTHTLTCVVSIRTENNRPLSMGKKEFNIKATLKCHSHIHAHYALTNFAPVFLQAEVKSLTRPPFFLKGHNEACFTAQRSHYCVTQTKREDVKARQSTNH